ncbi:hypothetical protein [Fulvivirga sedimenti]|uniref:Circularly permuted type 2 ATP-grasp protein n=1 Tax=Fulvivirga sedimenti TaxID=2879465 RepID=A0A9X1KYT0_9BACT|nr:hypothetical protein [Fulvivirga sedimenti]MCA6075132.1 hypothetical protein [Fulvivirga sedimenti]MCA6076309.1 hypothetical protein [Fulvivirga sedimenti]MCA6077437.1 hypothetical protein [Fulvivirga sedimenti]
MIPSIREEFNRNFTQEKYQAFLDFITEQYGHKPPFRIAETPVFIPDILKKRLIEACEDINAVICKPDFKEITREAIKHPMLEVPGEDYHTRFLQMDFGICLDENGEPFPQLIEVQGFPSLYFFQDLLSSAYKKFFEIPQGLTVHVNNIDRETYVEMLREIIVGDSNPRNVVLLEIEPEKQNTYIDFLGAEAYLGIKILCITRLKKDGRRLYYLDDDGNEVTIHKIYNRVIFDELDQRTDLELEFSFKDDVDVEWVGHPNWFFRISKYTMPLLKSKYVPECHYLDKLEKYPEDLENYVLKPLYSFAGAGVRLNVTAAELDALADKHNYILQRRVKYEPVIRSINEPVKCEIRMLMLWKKGETQATIVNNLIRLSKGEMIGVKYNKDKDWVGASVGFFSR